MRDDDKQRFAAVMTGIAEYYGKDFSAPVIELYWQGMCGYEIDDVSRAVSLHMRDAERGSFLPKISDLVRLIEGTSGDRAQLAWTKLHTAIQRIGPYQTVVFDDPIIHRVVEDMGGWGRLCDLKTEEAPFSANEFCKRYRAYSARRVTPEHLPRLMGIVEADCRTRGLLEHIPQPMLIGDENRALAVMHSGSASAGAVTYRSAGEHLAAIVHKRNVA